MGPSVVPHIFHMGPTKLCQEGMCLAHSQDAILLCLSIAGDTLNVTGNMKTAAQAKVVANGHYRTINALE